MLERLGGDALILHYNIWRVWIVPEYAPGSSARCCSSPLRSTVSLRYGLVAGGCLIFWGGSDVGAFGGGGMLQLSITNHGACCLFPILIFF
jgi:hypothetical protein